MKKIGKTVLILALVLLTVALSISCQNIFGTSTDVERVYGDWLYQKDSGFEIKLSLRKDGTYFYQEISSYGKILYENSGKFSLSPTRLILKGLDDNDGDRFYVFSISMKESSDGGDILELVPTLTKKYTFKRCISIDEPSISLDIDGTWYSDEFGQVEIGDGKIVIDVKDGTPIAFKIEKAVDNKLFIDSQDYYSEIDYFTVNGTLYVVFPKLSDDAHVFNVI